MRRYLILGIAVVALALCPGAAAVAPPVPAESAIQKVVYLGDRGPVVIELTVRIDGRSFRAVNRDFMNALFDHLDRDGDGVLSKAEAAVAPPAAALSNSFALFGGRGVRIGTGQVTREALAAFYRKAGLAPFQVSYTPRDRGIVRLRIDGRSDASHSAEQITTRLYELLDADKDGKLSAKELAAAPGLLKKLDADEDEMLSTAELMGDTRPAGDGPFALAFSPDGQAYAPVGGRILHVLGDGGEGAKALETALAERYGKDKMSADDRAKVAKQRPAARVTVRLGMRAANEPIVEVADGKLPAGVKVEKTRDGAALVVGISRLELGGPPRDDGPTFAGFNVTAQYKAQFQSADADGNGYLDKQEAAKSGFFRDTFEAMDADGDGMLYEKEMLAFVKKMESLRTLAGKSCVSLVVTNKGKGLFELFDGDGDGRLSVRELRGAGKVLQKLDADKDGALAKAEVPTFHGGAFELGPAGGVGNAGRVAFIAGGMPAPAPPAPTKGPLWFRKMDRNRDGDVSRGEFLGTDAQFEAIDADGDGLISVAEAERYDKRAKQRKE